ncbi:hypothetical protein HK098_007933 [Nowakowskiella sp. JEL0407]|nr:hypothetical protein HK098_007933 [Nowakowskiella sp. JEL0407]
MEPRKHVMGHPQTLERTVGRWSVIPEVNSTVTLYWDYYCNGHIHRDRIPLKIYRRQNEVYSLVKFGDSNSVCESNTRGENVMVKLQMCVKSYATNSGHLTSSFKLEEFATVMTDYCTNTYAYIKPTAWLASGSLFGFSNDFRPTIVFALIFVSSLTVWLFIMLISYRYHKQIQKDFERMALKDRKVVDHQQKAMIKQLVNPKTLLETPPEIREKLLEFASGFHKISRVAEEVGNTMAKKSAREDFYWRPAQSRIDKVSI